MIIRRNIDGHADVAGAYVRYEDHATMLNRMAWDLAKALNYLEEHIDALYVHDVSGEWCVDHEYSPTEAAQFLQTVENTEYEVDMSPRARSMREAAPEMFHALRDLVKLAMYWEQKRYSLTHEEMMPYKYQPEIYAALRAIAKAEWSEQP